MKATSATGQRLSVVERMRSELKRKQRRVDEPVGLCGNIGEGKQLLRDNFMVLMFSWKEASLLKMEGSRLKENTL